MICGLPARRDAHLSARHAALVAAASLVLAIAGSAALAAPAANSPPTFPRAVKFVVKTSYEYDPAGRLFGGVTRITIKTPPKDADGDRLTFKWTAVSTFRDGTRRANKIRGRGLTAVWTRDMDYGELAAGIVTLTVRDGRGGKAIRTFKFERGAG